MMGTTGAATVRGDSLLLDSNGLVGLGELEGMSEPQREWSVTDATYA